MPPPQPLLMRCVCKSHGCGSTRGNDGLRGVLLNKKTFDRHKSHDEYSKHQEIQQIALDQENQRLSEAVSRLSLADRAIVDDRPSQDKYRINRTRNSVAAISSIRDDIEGVWDTISSVSSEPSTVDDGLIDATLRHLDTMERQCSNAQLRLRNFQSKEKAVTESRRSAEQDLFNLFARIEDLRKAWTAFRSHCDAQRKNNIDRLSEIGVAQYDSSHHYQPGFVGVKPILQLVTLMVVACHVILGLPRRGCYWLFSMSSYILQTTVMQALQIKLASLLLANFSAMLSGFPLDIRTATHQFNVEEKAVIYACCPKCHSTYGPVFRTPVPEYRERCNFHRYGSRCGELLVHPKHVHNTIVHVPIKPYIAFDFKDWVANLLSREGYEEAMDKAWDRMQVPADGALTDIFQGSVIRDFTGPDRKRHFHFSGGSDAGHYLFSLSMDFFNPLRNMAAGKPVSIGALTMVCLNLPIDLRYKPENMFLAGIIPGPQEPPLDAINPYLRPLINILLEFWDGMHFTRTTLYESGRLIFCAVVAIICDLPAARKIAGFSSHNHEYFCSICWCNK